MISNGEYRFCKNKIIHNINIIWKYSLDGVIKVILVLGENNTLSGSRQVKLRSCSINRTRVLKMGIKGR